MKINLKKIAGIAMVLAAGTSCFAWGKWNSKKSINVLSREEGSGTRGAFVELFGIERKDSSGKKVGYTTDEATDLRFITAALKMITDMERIGDHAVDIAERVVFALTGKKE